VQSKEGLLCSWIASRVGRNRPHLHLSVDKGGTCARSWGILPQLHNLNVRPSGNRRRPYPLSPRRLPGYNCGIGCLRFACVSLFFKDSAMVLLFATSSYLAHPATDSSHFALRNLTWFPAPSRQYKRCRRHRHQRRKEHQNIYRFLPVYFLAALITITMLARTKNTVQSRKASVDITGRFRLVLARSEIKHSKSSSDREQEERLLPCWA
jgi:hypothetical protein